MRPPLPSPSPTPTPTPSPTIPIPPSLLTPTFAELVRAHKEHGGVCVPVTPTMLQLCIEAVQTAPSPEGAAFLDAVASAAVVEGPHQAQIYTAPNQTYPPHMAFRCPPAHRPQHALNINATNPNNNSAMYTGAPSPHWPARPQWRAASPASGAFSHAPHPPPGFQTYPTPTVHMPTARHAVHQAPTPAPSISPAPSVYMPPQRRNTPTVPSRSPARTSTSISASTPTPTTASAFTSTSTPSTKELTTLKNVTAVTAPSTAQNMVADKDEGADEGTNQDRQRTASDPSGDQARPGSYTADIANFKDLIKLLEMTQEALKDTPKLVKHFENLKTDYNTLLRFRDDVLSDVEKINERIDKLVQDTTAVNSVPAAVADINERIDKLVKDIPTMNRVSAPSKSVTQLQKLSTDVSTLSQKLKTLEERTANVLKLADTIKPQATLSKNLTQLQDKQNSLGKSLKTATEDIKSLTKRVDTMSANASWDRVQKLEERVDKLAAKKDVDTLKNSVEGLATATALNDLKTQLDGLVSASDFEEVETRVDGIANEFLALNISVNRSLLGFCELLEQLNLTTSTNDQILLERVTELETMLGCEPAEDEEESSGPSLAKFRFNWWLTPREPGDMGEVSQESSSAGTDSGSDSTDNDSTSSTTNPTDAVISGLETGLVGPTNESSKPPTAQSTTPATTESPNANGSERQNRPPNATSHLPTSNTAVNDPPHTRLSSRTLLTPSGIIVRCAPPNGDTLLSDGSSDKTSPPEHTLTPRNIATPNSGSTTAEQLLLIPSTASTAEPSSPAPLLRRMADAEEELATVTKDITAVKDTVRRNERLRIAGRTMDKILRDSQDDKLEALEKEVEDLKAKGVEKEKTITELREAIVCLERVVFVDKTSSSETSRTPSIPAATSSAATSAPPSPTPTHPEASPSTVKKLKPMLSRLGLRRSKSNITDGRKVE